MPFSKANVKSLASVLFGDAKDWWKGSAGRLCAEMFMRGCFMDEEV
jgi:hypothetical protein